MRAGTGLAISYDPRDLIYESGSLLPPSAGRRSKTHLHHPIDARDQGKEVRCCVSVAISTCMEILDAQTVGNGFTPLSVLFHYYVARKHAGKDTSYFGTMTFQEGFAGVLEYGICAQDKHMIPITPENARRRPSPRAYDDARNRKIKRDAARRWQYRKIDETDRVDAWREVLNAKHPIAMGLWVTDAYHKLSETGGVHRVPASPGGRSVCHAVTVTGYDDGKRDVEGEAKGAFLIKDSRGPMFCNKGCWWLPYKLAGGGVIYQSWTIAAVSY